MSQPTDTTSGLIEMNYTPSETFFSGAEEESKTRPVVDFNLGLDLRIAAERPDQALIAEVFMGQAKSMELYSPANSPIVVTHGTREWDGCLKHASADKKLLRWNWFSKWEKEFSTASKLEVWHQFSPVDKIRAAAGRRNLATVLPAVQRIPQSLRMRPGDHFVVPSQHDARRLGTLSRGVPAQVHAIVPAVRPYVFETPVLREVEEGWLLFIVGDRKDVPRADKWMQIIASRYPKAPKKIVDLQKDAGLLSTDNWASLWRKARLCFYLSRSGFDWAVPALEAMYCRIPTVFLDDCHALSELLPRSPLSLPRFLVENPRTEALEEYADEAFSLLQDVDVFHPTRLAARHYELYQAARENEASGMEA